MTTVAEKVQQMLSEADSAIQEAENFIISNGQVMNLTDWVTIREYCNQYDIKNVETVLNWIKRGIIPREDVRTIKELNNIRLIRAKEYNPKTVKAV